MSFYQDQTLLSREAFQELLRERIAERKRLTMERRQEGLRQISEMKSKSGVSPLELFPKEIWLKITDTVNPEDRGNICRVHPTFANLMESTYIQDTLFPQALKFVLDYTKNNDEDVGWHNMIREDYENDNGVIVCWDGPKLSIPFVKLREVSKSLRLAVDRWFEKEIHEELHLRPEDKPADWKSLPRLTIYHLSPYTQRLYGLIENYSNTPVNYDSDDAEPLPKSSKAFFTRSIEVDMSLDLRDETDPDNFIPYDEPYLRDDSFLPIKADTIKLLQLIGDQILFFKLRVCPVKYFDIAGISFADFYLLLQEYCSLMPKLVGLEVCFQIGEGMVACEEHDLLGDGDLDENEDEDEDEDEVPEKLINLIMSIAEHPFPTLDKLESISIEEDYNISVTSKIYEAILKANQHVQMLKLKDDHGLIEETAPQDALKALNLKCFCWQSYTSPSSPGSSTLVCKNWPLTTLVLWPRSQTLNNVLKTLEEFPNLEKVTLRMSEIGNEIQFLNLPNLTLFEWKFRGSINYKRDDVNFVFSLQFLLYSKRLKKLRWSYFPDGIGTKKDETLQRFLKNHECSEKMTDFRGGMRNLSSSNIWKIFPELESVDIEYLKKYDGSFGTKRYYRPN